MIAFRRPKAQADDFIQNDCTTDMDHQRTHLLVKSMVNGSIRGVAASVSQPAKVRWVRLEGRREGKVKLVAYLEIRRGE